MTKDEFQKAVDDVITDCIRNDYSFGSYARKVTEAVWPLFEAAEKERVIDEQRIADLMADLNRVGHENDALRIELDEIQYGVAVAHDTIKALRAKVEAAESDAAHQKAIAESALRVAEGWERKCGELRSKIEQMERQEPTHWACKVLQADASWKEEVSREVPPEGYFSVRDIFPLYALPGAQPGFWQPIETAPKDRFVLLCGPSGYTTIPMVVTTGRMCSDYHAGRWIDHANDDLTDWGFEPTHWAPLPELPCAKGE